MSAEGKPMENGKAPDLEATQPPLEGAELPVFLGKHGAWTHSKGRNPLGYTATRQQGADCLVAIARGEPL